MILSACMFFYIVFNEDYRVYNFDAKKKIANIKIFEKFDEKDFRLAPTYA